MATVQELPYRSTLGRFSGPILLDRGASSCQLRPAVSPVPKCRGHPHRGLERAPGPGPPAKADPYDLAEGQDVLDNLNPNSLEILTGTKLEPSLANAKVGVLYQFERVGYFCLDPDSTPDKLVFNRTLPLKDSWAKIEKKAGA